MKNPSSSREVSDRVAIVYSIGNPSRRRTLKRRVQTQTWLILRGCGRTSSIISFLRRPSARSSPQCHRAQMTKPCFTVLAPSGPNGGETDVWIRTLESAD
jgi:hypothetical protein